METTKKSRPEVGQIFTNGAHCEPRKLTVPETGEVVWGWVVVSFEDDSYMNGQYVDPAEFAGDKDELIKDMEDD